MLSNNNRVSQSHRVIDEEYFVLPLSTIMDNEKIKCILSLLVQYELTLREKQFVDEVGKYFKKSKVTDQQESVNSSPYLSPLRRSIAT